MAAACTHLRSAHSRSDICSMPAMVIALAAAAASLSEHPSTAAILVLAVTVGTWVLSFVAAFQGGIWEQIAELHARGNVAGLPPRTRAPRPDAGCFRRSSGIADSRRGLDASGRAGAARRLAESVVILVHRRCSRPSRYPLRIRAGTSPKMNGILFVKPKRRCSASITAPLKITAHLAPEDPRRFDLEKQTFSKLRRTMSQVTVDICFRHLRPACSSKR